MNHFPVMNKRSVLIKRPQKQTISVAWKEGNQSKVNRICGLKHEKPQFDPLTDNRQVRTILRALANDSMATASFPGVLLARSLTTLAISISEQPDGGSDHTELERVCAGTRSKQ